MVGSGFPLDPRILEGFGTMTQTAMEQLLENVDQRLARVEQILPTLATKQDLERFATKDDVADAKRYALMLNEATGTASSRRNA